jgi:hypothetical protein
MRVTLLSLLIACLAPSGCQDHCTPETYFCDGAHCDVVWDCGNDRRELHVGPGLCECVHDRDVTQGSCGADLCSVLEAGDLAALREGESGYASFDDAVNDACDWNISTVEPIVIGGCPVPP